jgi:glutathione synthase/RimK-type ligase-like ATP-grasp enzyme
VLKRPDSSFSLGVVRAKDASELKQHMETFLASSELVVAQEYVPSGFDWRVGVLDRRALYVCKYHMARGHWQIQRNDSGSRRVYGKVETIAVDDAPSAVVDLGVKAASLFGEGLYGVDVKQVGERCLVIEVNDNPNIEAGCEDAILKDELYNRVMRSFLQRLEDRVHGR